MKLEIRCTLCGHGHLVDEARIPASGGVIQCQGCDASIRLPTPSRVQQPAAVAVSAGEPVTEAIVQPRVSSQRMKSRAAAAVAPPRPAKPASPTPSTSGGSEVVCPRCSLHFTFDPSKEPGPRGVRPTVLVVEDMEYFLDIAREALAGKYNVKTSGNLADARKILESGGVDLILLDPTLEDDEDGLELLRCLPEKPCPILIFTDQDESDLYGGVWERLRALGADDVVIKGMNVGESLLRKVGTLLGEPTPVEDSAR